MKAITSNELLKAINLHARLLDAEQAVETLTLLAQTAASDNLSLVLKLSTLNLTKLQQYPEYVPEPEEMVIKNEAYISGCMSVYIEHPLPLSETEKVKKYELKKMSDCSSAIEIRITESLLLKTLQVIVDDKKLEMIEMTERLSKMKGFTAGK